MQGEEEVLKNGDIIVISNEATHEEQRLQMLQEKILKQVEFYFSDANIVKDAYLLNQISKNEQGFVRLDLIANFKRMKALSTDLKVILNAIEHSKTVVLSSDKKSIRRKNPLPAQELLSDAAFRTVIAINLNMERPTIDKIKELFSECGEVLHVRILQPNCNIPKDLQVHLIKHGELGTLRCALIEYKSVEMATKACNELTNNADWRTGMHVDLLAKPKGKKKQWSHSQGHTGGGAGGGGDRANKKQLFSNRPRSATDTVTGGGMTKHPSTGALDKPSSAGETARPRSDSASMAGHSRHRRSPKKKSNLVVGGLRGGGQRGCDSDHGGGGGGSGINSATGSIDSINKSNSEINNLCDKKPPTSHSATGGGSSKPMSIPRGGGRSGGRRSGGGGSGSAGRSRGYRSGEFSNQDGGGSFGNSPHSFDSDSGKGSPWVSRRLKAMQESQGIGRSPKNQVILIRQPRGPPEDESAHGFKLKREQPPTVTVTTSTPDTTTDPKVSPCAADEVKSSASPEPHQRSQMSPTQSATANTQSVVEADTSLPPLQLLDEGSSSPSTDKNDNSSQSTDFSTARETLSSPVQSQS